MMEIWLKARENKDLFTMHRVERCLYRAKSQYQDLAVVDSPQFGRMLLLDGVIQTTIRDEPAYHEMIAHVPLFAHPGPKRVLIIGGGDGGTLREVLRHPEVEEAHLVEIDAQVIEASRRYLPELAVGFDDARVEVHIADGIKHVQEAKDLYDVVIVDSCDPLGPAVGLFNYDFYRNVRGALRKDGILVAQIESPFFNMDLVKQVYGSFTKLYPIVRPYLTSIPSYSPGIWSFMLASKKHDPRKAKREPADSWELRYYTSELHRAAFALPAYYCQALEETAEVADRAG